MTMLYLFQMLCDSSQSIIFCCDNNKAMIKGSVGKGSPLALIATEYL